MVPYYDLKAVKFGGSSLSCAEQIIKCANIIKGDRARRFIIPSAPGKRFATDEKITDMLIRCHRTACDGGDISEIFGRIKDRFCEIVSGLQLSFDIEPELDAIKNDISNGATLDYAASRGEYLCGLILSELLGYAFIDPKGLILFDEQGNYLSKETHALLSDKLSALDNAVIPGFYGSTADGRIKTFSRGGSDITGAIVARAIGADLYENWTDVSGFLMCDPHIVKDPKPIKSVTYRELRELSYMGATVLHEDSVFPVKLASIPINIRNTNSPQDAGTMIVPSAGHIVPRDTITGIAGKKHLAVIRIEKDKMNQEIGFGAKVLSVFSDRGLSFEHLPSGIDTMCVVISEDEVEGKEREVMTAITKAVNPDSIVMEKGLALVAVVGRGMINAPGTASRIFTAIARENINIRMIDQGSSELNIIIGVDQEEFEVAIRAIYKEFCE